MPTRRCRMMMALLLCVPAAPTAIDAQAPEDRIAVGEAALAGWEHFLRSKQCAYCTAELILEPLVLRARWEHGLQAEPAATRSRDSIELRRLTGALHGRAATADLVSQCAGNFPKTECPLSFRTGRIVAISDPRVVGDTATLVLVDGPPNILGNSSGMGGRTTLVYMVRVVRTNGMWTLRCLAFAASDYSPTPDQVEASCSAASSGRGG